MKTPEDLAREIGFMAAYCVREQVGDVEREEQLEEAADLIREDREASKRDIANKIIASVSSVWSGYQAIPFDDLLRLIEDTLKAEIGWKG